jgi:hypothetical protein
MMMLCDNPWLIFLFVVIKFCSVQSKKKLNWATGSNLAPHDRKVDDLTIAMIEKI